MTYPRFLLLAALLASTLNLTSLVRAAPAQEDSTTSTSAPAASTADDEFGKKATWQPPSSADVRKQVFDWLHEQSKDDAVQKQAAALWPADAPDAKPLAGVDLLQRMVKVLAVADSNARGVAEVCFAPRKGIVPRKFDFLTDSKLDPLVRNNLRLAYGRWLAQERLYDESIEQLSGLQTTDVVDPASLLFYQSVGYHYLLNKEEGLKSLAKLMEREKDLPKRYVTTAGLMKEDLAALKDESLDHISRRMDDVKRRLDFGRTGKKVRGEEDGIIASLDKLIDDLEKQQQQQQQQSQSSPRNSGQIKPAQESKPMELKGPGEVANKNIGNRSGWGDLPPKQREEAMQQIGKEFPSHYRDIIEQYFRKMAAEESEDK